MDLISNLKRCISEHEVFAVIRERRISGSETELTLAAATPLNSSKEFREAVVICAPEDGSFRSRTSPDTLEDGSFRLEALHSNGHQRVTLVFFSSLQRAMEHEREVAPA